jgi:2',3'-cyclic-nucleotide 2'-phosphodiesterase (5'-nucleotidase family)
MKKLRTLLVAFVVFATACHTTKPASPTTVVYQDYQINNTQKQDPAVLKMLAPYSDTVKAVMNKVIGFSLQALYKKQPESPLGNFMTDALKEMTEKKFNMKIDAALVNYGGIRGNLPKGDITVGTVYELMPFDNVTIVLELTGKQLQQLLDLTADRGGWPVSGLKLDISNKKAVNVLVNGKALQPTAKYFVALPDYVANGGDDALFLKAIPQINKGYLMRDAYMEYIQQLTKAGKPVTANVENRITNVN